MLSVIAYTGGNSPSGIFRVAQYQGPLSGLGIDFHECRSTAGVYPPERKWLRPGWALWNLVDRVPDTLRSFAYDLVFFQREMLSTFVTWEPMTKHPRILDVDDAIWAHRRGDFARRLARLCDHVICGNQFLAEKFSHWNSRVSILPTPVDTAVFCPAGRSNHSHDSYRPIIGWMGLPSGFGYLYTIEKALATVLKTHPEAILRIVSSRRPQFRFVPADQVQHVQWSQDNEARTMQDMTVGIMPLDDTLFARGKCSFKMLLYMASGLPVVVSPVGMNAEILEHDAVGFGPRSENEWVDNLNYLLANRDLCEQMGQRGRDVVVKHYSVQALTPVLARTIQEVAGKTPQS